MPNLPDCFTHSTNPKLVVSEHGKRACVLNPTRSACVISKVDGCIVTNERAADYVLSKCQIGHLIVELKGKDVEHACSQVIATASDHMAHCRKATCGQDCAKRCLKKCIVAALVIANRYPKHTSIVARKQEEFAKKFSAPLRVRTSSAELEFEDAFRFS